MSNGPRPLVNPYTQEGILRRPYFQPLPENWKGESHRHFFDTENLEVAAQILYKMAKKRGHFKNPKPKKKTIVLASTGFHIAELPEDEETI